MSEDTGWLDTETMSPQQGEVCRAEGSRGIPWLGSHWTPENADLRCRVASMWTWAEDPDAQSIVLWFADNSW